MQAARWHEYQDSYRKYGFDMKPKHVRTVKQSPAGISIGSKDKKRILALTFIVGIVGIAIIISAAFAASLQYEINQIAAANEQIEREIANMDIKLQVANGVTVLEEKATGELGMRYPKSDQIVYIDSITAPQDFAATVREEAYN